MRRKKPKQTDTGSDNQAILNRIVEYYHHTCREEPAVHQYLERMGITDPVLFDAFRIGYSNGSLFDVIPDEGDIIERLKTIGILTPDGKETFADCVVFPISDDNGDVVNLYGRKMKGRASTEIALPNNRSGVWNGEVLKNQDSILLTQSVLDSLALIQAGIKNTIPVNEDMGITEDYQQAFKQNHTRELILIFDDEKQAQPVTTALEGYDTRLVKLPKSPYRYLLKNSPDDLEGLVYGDDTDEQTSDIHREEVEDGFILNICRRKYIIRGIETSHNKLRVNVRIEKHKEFHIDTLDLYSAKARKPLIREIADFYQADMEVINKDLDRIITEVEAFIEKRKRDNGQIFVNVPDKDRDEAVKFGKQDNLAEAIINDLGICGYVGEEANKLMGYLAMSSRKMDSPLSVMILSGSGAGKTSLQDTILGLCPTEDLVKLTALTGKLSTMQNIVKCRTSVFLTTTSLSVNPETQSRFLILSVDESAEQTRRILEYQRYMETLEGYQQKKQRDAIINKHQNFQRLLQPVMVFNPFAQRLSYIDDRLQVRRDHPKYMAIIKAIAFVNQMNREIKRLDDGTEYIEVRLDDIDLANQLAHKLLGNTLDELSIPSRRLLELIDSMVNGIAKEQETDRRDITFTRRQIREHINWSDYQIKTHIKQLVDLEYLGVIHGRKGQQYSYCLYYNGEGRDGSRFLLGLKDVDELCQDIKTAHSNLEGLGG